MPGDLTTEGTEEARSATETTGEAAHPDGCYIQKDTGSQPLASRVFFV